MTDVRDRRYDLGMKRAISGILAGVVWVSWGPAAGADIVHDGRGPFQNVRIIGIVDDELRFRMPDGRTIAKRASELEWITVSAGRGPTAPTLNRAENARRLGKLARAIGHYSSVRTDAELPWMRAFAVMRLASANDRLGEFVPALDFYLELAGTHPLLARSVVPTHLPAKGSAEAKAALGRIKAELRRSLSKDVKAALNRLQKVIQTGRRAKPDSDGKKKAHARGKTRSSAYTQMDLVRAAIADGMIARAEVLFESGWKESKARDRPAWLVMEAELRCAAQDYAAGGLAAMRVVALHGDSPEAAAGLFWAGRNFEGLGRPAKAKELYLECLQQADLGEPVRALATARLESLTQTEESR